MNMFTERVHSRAQAREANRGKDLRAAESLFVRQGFAPTTIRQIAEDAAVSVGTVMSVTDKNGLLVAIFDQRIVNVGPSPSEPQIPHDPAAEIVEILGGFVRLF